MLMAALTTAAIAGCAGASTAPTSSATPSPTATNSSTTPGSTSTDPAVTAALDELEARYESRLGVWALDTATGREV
ncbi:MAG: hypothetical protein JWQ43_3005, partial [Glaciihabitans sp.]|nr:hypothetical protein [Glaciihabitans sp.]